MERAAGSQCFEFHAAHVDSPLYYTPFNCVIALDPETGTALGVRPKITLDGEYGDGPGKSRASLLLDPFSCDRPACRRRIFEVTQDARLVALDVATRLAMRDFGEAGK